MKTELTNKLTKVFFTQYGEQKMVEYNGTATQARNYCKGAYGINTINTFYTVERKVFLPVGCVSIEIVN
jgi:hypothetical protein